MPGNLINNKIKKPCAIVTEIYMFSLCLISQPLGKLPRFPALGECLSDVEPDTRQMVRAQNKKKKKSGGFQSMGKTH